MTKSWDNPKSRQLFKAILLLETGDEVAAFLRDLLTEPEIAEFSKRWEAAKELNKGKTQRQIAKETGTSLSTVTRVNQYLTRGMNGYRLLLDRISSKNHTHPA